VMKPVEEPVPAPTATTTTATTTATSSDELNAIDADIETAIDLSDLEAAVAE